MKCETTDHIPWTPCHSRQIVQTILIGFVCIIKLFRKAHVEDLAASYEKPADVIRWYYGDNRRMAEVEAVVIENNVTEYILAKAKVTDKAVSFDELMGQN